MRIVSFLFIAMILFFECQSNPSPGSTLEPGAHRFTLYLDMLNGSRVGIVANQSSRVDENHLLDTLLSLNIDVKRIFTPEHGFRGTEAAGEYIESELDKFTGLPMVSLYGRNKKPSATNLEDLDVILFDLQDVGVRFYTYISTLHLVMEACAENGLHLIVLDRPNPNAHYVDGPVLEEKHTSFVGMHPVPVVYGMTIGEYARMINGEGWLKGGLKCNLTVIPCKSYDHNTFYDPPVKPSPNLPDLRAIRLYPSLCFFEGTVVSVGRGTPFPFQVYGHPQMEPRGFNFVPESTTGAGNPKWEGEICHGVDLRDFPFSMDQINKLNLEWLMEAHRELSKKTEFFNSYFEKLSGTDSLRIQIEKGWSEERIRRSWKKGITDFHRIRKKYLIYD